MEDIMKTIFKILIGICLVPLVPIVAVILAIGLMGHRCYEIFEEISTIWRKK